MSSHNHQPTALFGKWAQSEEFIEVLCQTFSHATPFQHVVIPNFFSDTIANAIEREFPLPHTQTHDWKHYDNPIEQKYALNDFTGLHQTRVVFDSLQTDAVLEIMQRLTSIPDLEADPHLHGAGLHAYPRNGKLDIHLDYSIHPISGRERRVNLIVYLNKNWQSAYGGNLELWDASLSHCTNVITPTFNTAVLFRTSDISYHGLPIPLRCPYNEYRKSLAIYYVSPSRPEAQPRYKAEFFPHPGQRPIPPQLEELYCIRKTRLITPEDLENWPKWREEGRGFW